MPAREVIAARYVLFAILAALLNFGAQAVSLTVIHGPLAFWSSVVIGTGVGFFVKYILDKLFIFRDRHESLAREANKIFLYGLSAVLTTLIFWLCEWTSWFVWQNSLAKYAGGAFGLAAGYVLKYHMDKRLAFRPVGST
jgi:putative flippase GtrA